MQEQFTSPNEEDKTWREDTDTTKKIGAAPKIPLMPKRALPLSGKTIEPDLRIDLDSPDALERLDDIHAELGSGKEIGESEEVTPEDEKELEEAFADIDRQKAEDAADPEMREILEARKRRDDEEVRRSLEELGKFPNDGDEENDEPTVVGPSKNA